MTQLAELENGVRVVLPLYDELRVEGVMLFTHTPTQELHTHTHVRLGAVLDGVVDFEAHADLSDIREAVVLVAVHGRRFVAGNGRIAELGFLESRLRTVRMCGISSGACAQRGDRADLIRALLEGGGYRPSEPLERALRLAWIAVNAELLES